MSKCIFPIHRRLKSAFEIGYEEPTKNSISETAPLRWVFFFDLEGIFGTIGTIGTILIDSDGEKVVALYLRDGAKNAKNKKPLILLYYFCAINDATNIFGTIAVFLL